MISFGTFVLTNLLFFTEVLSSCCLPFLFLSTEVCRQLRGGASGHSRNGVHDRRKTAKSKHSAGSKTQNHGRS